MVMLMKKPKYEIKFWEKWLNADIERVDLVKKLPFFKMSLKMKDNSLFKHAFATMLNGYFEDLESSVYTKMEYESQARDNKMGKKM